MASCFKTLQFDIMNVQKWIEFQCGKNQDGRCVGKKQMKKKSMVESIHEKTMGKRI